MAWGVFKVSGHGNLYAGWLRADPIALLFRTEGQRYHVRKEAGWHLSYYMGLPDLARKLESFSHSEYDAAEFKAMDHIRYTLPASHVLSWVALTRRKRRSGVAHFGMGRFDTLENAGLMVLYHANPLSPELAAADVFLFFLVQGVRANWAGPVQPRPCL